MKNQTGDEKLSAPSAAFSTEEAMSLVLNNLQETFLLIDLDFKVILTNDYTRSEIHRLLHSSIHRGMSVLDLVPHERKFSLIQLYQSVFSGETQRSEIELMDEGKKVVFENIFQPARNREGQIVGAVVRSREVTSQREAADHLKALEERWRFALEGGKQGVWDWNIQTGDVFYSPSCKKIYGYADHEMANRIEAWAEIVHPEDRQKIGQAIAEHISNSNPYYESTYRIQTRDGNFKWILARGTLVQSDEQNRPIRMIGTHTDISDQIRTEEAIRISNDRYSHAILATSDIVWDWDLESDKVFWSDNFTKVLGWELPADKMLPITACDSHYHPEDAARVHESMQAAIADEKITNWQAEFRYRKADGSYAIVSDRGYVIRNQQGKALRMIGAMQDITERKQNEQILSLERRIFEMTAKLNVSFESILSELLEGLELIYPTTSTLVMQLKDEIFVDCLVSRGIPKEYIAHIDGLAIGPEKGSCGTAMYTREPVIVEDIQTDNRWKDYREVAGAHGLQSCWAFPIVHSSGKTLGCFAVYFRQKKSPTTSDLHTLERMRNILRVLLEHNWSINQIKAVNERFDIMMKATHDLIWDWDLDSNIIYRDELGLRKVYGLSSNDTIQGIYQWLGRIHPEDRSRAESVINDILQSTHEDTFDLEYRFLREDGTYSHVYDRGMIIRDEDGKPSRMIGAAQDVTERKRLEQELLQNELERQKAINQATVDTQEQERGEIGKELHDNVNQVLTTTKLYLDLAQTNSELKDELIRKSSQNILSVINEIRQLSRSLMDPSIGDLGLIDSTYDLIESINMTRKLQVQLKANKELEDVLDKNQKLTVFRIVQEALNNAIKHAKATHVSVTFQSYNTFFEIIIQDNGIGFDPESIRKGAGLKNIQNRIYLVNGSHYIETAPGKGCKIIINFPINTKK